MCNRREILGLRCIRMPASKYTVFVHAVEQYKWFHASDWGVSSSIIPSYFYCFQRLPAELSVFIFYIFFFLSHQMFFHAQPLLTHSLPTPVPRACLSPLAGFPLCSFYLIQTVIVAPRVQMFHSLPPSFSTWSCEKSHEPSRMHQSCQTSSLWTQQQTTQTLSKNTFCWPTLSGMSLPNGSGWTELRSDCWNGIGVKTGLKTIKVIWQTFYIIVWHYQQCSAEGCVRYPLQVTLV